MKKVLEDELMSLAHRILKLRNRADIHELKEEASILYEKLSILSFAEKHLEGIKPTINKHDIEKSIEKEFSLEHTSSLNFPDGTEYNEEPIYEHNTEKIKDIVSQMPIETQAVDKMFEEPIDNLKKNDSEIDRNNVIDLEDYSVHFDDLPNFEPADSSNTESADEPSIENKDDALINKKEEESNTDTEEKNAKNINNEIDESSKKIEKKPQRTKDLFSNSKKSLNDRLNKDLKIGLNDRLSFVSHLFLGNSNDYEDFIKKINTFNRLDEVKAFLNDNIQQKYLHWKDKEDVANRLLHLIEKKFE